MPNLDNANEPFQPATRSWRQKFADALTGIRQGIAGQSSFLVHFVVAGAVISLAALGSVTLERWCLLVLCIGMVLAAELFNSCLESLARSITSQYDPNIQRALNIASGSVLIVCIFSGVVGSLIFLDTFTGGELF